MIVMDKVATVAYTPLNYTSNGTSRVITSTSNQPIKWHGTPRHAIKPEKWWQRNCKPLCILGR